VTGVGDAPSWFSSKGKGGVRVSKGVEYDSDEHETRRVSHCAQTVWMTFVGGHDLGQ